jgi:hypothetical protein
MTTPRSARCSPTPPAPRLTISTEPSSRSASALFDPQTGDTIFSGYRSGSFGSAQMRDNACNSDALSFNNMTLNGGQVVGEPAGFTGAQLTLGLSSDGP